MTTQKEIKANATKFSNKNESYQRTETRHLTFENMFIQAENLPALKTHGLQPPTRKGAVTALADSIRQKGLEAPLSIMVEGDGYVILKGHLRRDAILQIHRLTPELYTELFPEGVPFKVYEGLTLEEQKEMVYDHADSRGLSSVREFFDVVKYEFGTGESFDQLAFRHRSSIDSLFKRTPKGEAAVKEIEDKLDTCTKDEAEAIHKDLVKAYGKYRRGVMQTMASIAKLPTCVEAYMYKQWNGEDVPRILSQGSLVKLLAAFRELMTTEGGSRHNPAKGWQEIWREATEPNAKKEKKVDDGKDKNGDDVCNVPFEDIKRISQECHSGLMAQILNTICHGSPAELMVVDIAMAKAGIVKAVPTVIADKSNQK